MKVWGLVARAVKAHGACAMVSVMKAEGSVPREEGARMVVTPQGFHGTIGGGTLEWKALAEAQRLLGKPGAVKMLTQSLGPDLGQCCGGRVTLAIENFSTASLAVVSDFAAREEQGSFTLTGRLGPNVTERFGEARRSVLLFGAGHVGRAVMLALAPLPYDVTWADPRPEAFPAAMPQNVTPCAGNPLEAAEAAPQGSFAFIMSHSHPLDLAIAEVALRNPAIAHVGVIGRATKRARFTRRLREAGVDDARITAMICPIGVGGIRSKLPAAIAVSVAAQAITLDEACAAGPGQSALASRDAG
jgi:xanthine dehydrogenase accessory factor